MILRENAAQLKELVEAPFVSVQYSALGGVENASLLLKVSLDARDTWSNGIFENSRYFHISIDSDGKMEQFGGGRGIAKKFRKSSYKSIEDAAKRLQKYIQEIS